MTMRTVILAVIGILSVSVTPAYAYVDPGSGGMIVQLLLGGVAGVAVLLKLFWHRLMEMVGLRRQEETTKEGD